MRNQRLAIILVISMFVLPKVELQEPTTVDTETENPETTTAKLMATEPTEATSTGDNSSEAMSTNGADTSADMTIANYVNRRIMKLLNENPKKDRGDLNIVGAFNEERKKLENATIVGNPSEDDYDKAELALDDFKSFLPLYANIENMLENALKNLTSYKEELSNPITKRYEALMLLITIKSRATIEEATEALEAYEDFQNNLSDSVTVEPTPEPKPESTTEPVVDMYEKYFQEILMILKSHTNNDTAMDTFLEQILKFPDELKSVYDLFKSFSSEDYDNNDMFLGDILSIFSYLLN